MKTSVSGHFSTSNDEMVVEDLMSILKNEVANKKNKNVDILSLSSQICLKLNGKCLLYSNTQRKYKLSVVFIFLYILHKECILCLQMSQKHIVYTDI